MTRSRSFPHFTLMAAALAVAGCAPSDRELEAAVRTYAARLIEAYRTSDPRPIEPVAGEEEGRKLTALIGVKRDMGIAMDARVLELTVRRVERHGDEWFVFTEERWYYQDRRIGSGERVGQDSTDRYWMRYRLHRRGKALVVEAADFERPPEVGRKEIPGASVEALHGVQTHPPSEGVPADVGVKLSPRPKEAP